MMNLFEMLQAIFGKNIMSRTIGTRTNVIKFPSNKNNPTTTSFDVFRASENPAVIEKLKKIIADEAPYIAKMNDSERTIYEGNVRRLHDHLVSTGEVKPAVSAEVIGLGDKQPVTGKGLESLTEQAGQVSAPGTMVGNIESRINKLKQLSQEMEKATGEKAGVGDILKQFGTEQGSMSRMQDEGLVRAAGRQILINDIKAGKIKNLNASEVLNMKEPLDPFRQIYGEGALEQLDSLIPEFRSLRTEMDAEKLARSKFKFEPNENRLPGSVSIEEGKKAEQEFGINSPKGLDYLTGGEPNKKPKVSDFKAEATKRKSIDELIDEYNANQDRLRLTDEEGGTKIGYEEFKNLQDRNREIEKALELKGISSEVEPKPEAEIIPFNKKPPEGKAEGGRIGYADGTPMSGLVYVNSWEGPWTGPEFLGGPTKGQYYNKRNILTPVNTEVAPVVTSSSYNLNPNASLKDQYLNRLAALQSSSLSSSSYQNFKNLLQSKLEGKAEGGRIGYQTGGPTNRFLKYMIDMLVKEKDFNRGLLERSKPELVEGLFKQTYGKSAEEIANAVNQQLKGKSSMEVMNPKTGEIISPTEPIKTGRTTADIEKEIDELSTTPITTLEKKRKYNDLHSEFINSLDPRGRNKNLDYRRKSLDLENRLLLKAEEKGLDFDTFEKLRQDLYGSKKQQTLDFMRTGKVNLEPIKPATTFEEVQNRHKIAAKAADEVFPNYNDPKTAAQELAEVMAEQKYKKSFGDLTGDKQSDLYSEAYNYITSVNKLPKVSPANVPTKVLQNKMNEVLNQYDKSMFIKNEQGMVDVTHPENVAKMEELLRRDHPELHSQLKKLGTDLDQKETLLDFDVTGRKPNAQGGIIRKKYGHEGAANPKRAQITAIYGEGTLPKDYSKGLGYLSGE